MQPEVGNWLDLIQTNAFCLLVPFYVFLQKVFSFLGSEFEHSVETAEKRCACDSGKGCHEFDVTDLQCATARGKKSASSND